METAIGASLLILNFNIFAVCYPLMSAILKKMETPFHICVFSAHIKGLFYKVVMEYA